MVQMTKEQELYENTRWKCARTLKMIASPENTLAYQNRVPFVRMFGELFAQLESIYRPRDCDWFQPIFSDKEREGLREFDEAINAFYEETDKDMVDDLPWLLANEGWHEVQKAAGKLLAILGEDLSV